MVSFVFTLKILFHNKNKTTNGLYDYFTKVEGNYIDTALSELYVL